MNTIKTTINATAGVLVGGFIVFAFFPRVEYVEVKEESIQYVSVPFIERRDHCTFQGGKYYVFPAYGRDSEFKSREKCEIPEKTLFEVDF